MTTKPPGPEALRNQLLAGLPAAELQRILPSLKSVALQRDDVLYDVDESITSIYFPSHAVLSALIIMEDGGAMEAGTIGNEGASGLSVLTGAPISLHRVVAQISGSALRVSADMVHREASRDGVLRQRLLNYHSYFFAQVSQSVACNGLHPLQKRCCRWLLMTHDRVDSDTLLLTHEYLAIMLGVRRAGVTEVLQSLQEQSLVRYSRGKITITNRAGLEALSCECYASVRQVYERLLG